MKSVKSVGRIIGILLLVQLAGWIVPFALILPIAKSDFLANAAGSSAQIKMALLLLLANCAVTIGISIAAFRVFRDKSPAITILLIVLSAIMFSLQAVDDAHLMTMLSLSQEYVKGNGSAELFQALSEVVRSTRRWTHYSELLAIDSWIFVFYCLLYRSASVPRVLAVFGFIAVLLHFIGIPLALILGYGSITPLGVPMALSHLALAFWLITKGFDEQFRGLR